METFSQVRSPLYRKTVDSDMEVPVQSGGTVASLSVMMAFIEPHDEVLVFQPVFDN